MSILRAALAFLAVTMGLRAAELMSVHVQEQAAKMTAADSYKQALVWVAELPNDGGSAIEYRGAAPRRLWWF